MSNFFLILIDFKWQKNKINIFKHENSKWRPNLRWTSKRSYWLKLENCYFLKFSFRLIKFGFLSIFLKKKRFPRNSIILNCGHIMAAKFNMEIFLQKYSRLDKMNILICYVVNTVILKKNYC
jgi:hypothetical protein